MVITSVGQSMYAAGGTGGKCDRCAEPEPVAWFIEGTYEDGTPSFVQVNGETDPEFYVPLYTVPPQREWQGLTDEEIGAMEKEYLFGGKEFDDEIGYWAVYRAIEAKLREKNG